MRSNTQKGVASGYNLQWENPPNQCNPSVAQAKIVSEILGHSSVAFTLDVYSHIVSGLQKALMKRLDEVLKPEVTENQNADKILVTDPDSDTEIGQIQTKDRRFTNSEPDVPPDSILPCLVWINTDFVSGCATCP